MNPEGSKPTKATTSLLFFLISSYILVSWVDTTIYSSGYYVLILPLIASFLLSGLIIYAVLTTILTWITVLVLLAFAGKRRRVLVKEGRRITSDVAMYLAQVVLKERSLVAVAFATVFSLMAMAIG